MWAYLLRGHHSTHYSFCWFWREWGRREYRRQACLELVGKTESHLPAESKDPVILNSPCWMQHPCTHSQKWDRGGGEDLYYSIPVTQPRPFWNQLLNWAYCVRVSVCLEATKACLGVVVSHCQGQWAEGRREQTCNGLSCPLAALKAASRACRNRDPFSTAAAIHRKNVCLPWSHKKPVLT